MKVDVNLINPFVSAMTSALETMVYVKPVRKGIKVKDNNLMIGDVSAVMALSGEAYGTVVLSFPENLACRLYSNMINMSADGELVSTTVDHEVEDGMREIVNLVAGGAKSELSKTKYSFKIGTPSIVAGKNHRISRDPNIPCIACDFEAAGETFTLEVSLTTSLG